jgi:hypothetical protein
MITMMSWLAILKHAPAILAAAEALRARTIQHDAGDRSQPVEPRLAELEADARATAQLTQQMAQQINALALAHESAARTARRALAVGIVALAVAIAGAALALV